MGGYPFFFALIYLEIHIKIRVSLFGVNSPYTSIVGGKIS